MKRLVSTVRFRLTVLATAVVVVVLVGVGYGLIANQRRTLTESLDERMAGRVEELADAIAIGQIPSLENLGDDDSVAQIVTTDGEVLAASQRLRGRPVMGEPIASGQTISSVGRLSGFDDDSRLLIRVVEAPNRDVVVHFAGSTDDISENVRTLATSLWIAVPLAAACWRRWCGSSPGGRCVRSSESAPRWPQSADQTSIDGSRCRRATTRSGVSAAR